MQGEGRTISGLDRVRTVWQRRKWPALVAFMTVFVAAAAVAQGLPKIYEASTTLLVERPQVSAPQGGASQELDLETRLRILSDQLQSRSRLAQLIDEFHLYPKLRRGANPEMAVGQMRRDIRLLFEGVRQPDIGLAATFAFNLAYRARDPETAARVVNVLALRYVDDYTEGLEHQTGGTSEFLQSQLRDAAQTLRQQEQRMAEFTAQHNGELPDQQSANLAALARLNEQLVVLMDRRNELTRQLVTAADSPTSAATPWGRLARLRQQLADLRARETDANPDVVRLKQQIAALEAQVSTAGADDPPPNDPRATIEAELTQLRSDEASVRRQIAALDQQVQAAPVRGQELQRISADYAAAKAHYESLLQRYQDSQLTAGLAQQRLQVEQIRVLDPALPPRTPAAPHRLRLVLLGLLLSLGAALAVVAVAEAFDTSFHTLDDLRAFTSVPVIASIPPIVTAADSRRQRRKLGIAAIAAALWIGAVAGVSYHLAHSDAPVVRMLDAVSAGPGSVST